MEKKRSKKKIGYAILALLLVLTLVAAPIVTLKTQIQFAKQNYVEKTAAYAAQITEESNEYLTENRLNRAWKYLQTVVGTPKTYHDYELYAQIAIAREDFDSAAEYLKGCIDTAGEENADPSFLYLRLGSLYILEEQPEAAMQALGKSIELDPGQTAAYYLRAQLETEAGEAEAAVADFRSYVWQPDAEPTIVATLGTVFETMGDLETAEKCYTAGIEAEVEDQASMYLGRAKCLGLQGDTKAAKSDLEKFFSLGGEDQGGQAAALLAMCLMEAEDYAGAEEYFHRAIESGYEDQLLLLTQSVKCAFAAGDYPGAVVDGEKALELIAGGAEIPADETGAVSDEAELHYWTGMSYMAQDTYKEAMRHFSETKAGRPDYPDIDYYVGVCALANEDYEDAAEAFTASIEKDEVTTICYYNRAVCEVRLEQYDEAKADLKAVVERGDERDLALQAADLLQEFEELESAGEDGQSAE